MRWEDEGEKEKEKEGEREREREREDMQQGGGRKPSRTCLE